MTRNECVVSGALYSEIFTGPFECEQIENNSDLFVNVPM